MASEFHPMCFCAIYWISKFREVPVSPEALITKPESTPPSCWCVQCSNASGTNRITLRTQVICQYTDGSWQWVHLSSSTWGDSKAVGISVTIVGSASASWISLSASGCCGWPQQPVSSWEMFLKIFKFKDYTYRIRFSEKGFSRLHFVVVLSKFLVIISKDHSLLNWKL